MRSSATAGCQTCESQQRKRDRSRLRYINAVQINDLLMGIVSELFRSVHLPGQGEKEIPVERQFAHTGKE